MGRDLTEPYNLHEWIRRLVSPRSVGVVMLILIAAVSELRFDWIERAVGAYLVTTNPVRPESGAIWEKGHRSLSAQDTLEQLVADRLASQREAQTSESFSQILQGLSNTEQVVISADHFRELYVGLPPDLAGEMISPYAMISLLNRRDWERTVFQKSSVGMTVYLLNSKNGVLRQLALPERLIARIERTEQAVGRQLEDIPAFSNRIYDAGRFFAALEGLPEDVRRNIIPWPETLLETDGPIARVGISDEINDGAIEIGFEIITPNRTKVITMDSKDWAVWQLSPFLGSAREIGPPSDADSGTSAQEPSSQ